MTIHPPDHFYSQLPLQRDSISEVLGSSNAFAEVPDDWHVVITDIKNSTKAVEDGLHNVVNLVATGSIIAALNLVRRDGFAIPFFFGGDGATLLVPDSFLKPLLRALTEHRENTRQNFDLELRVGNMPVSEVKKDGYDIQIAKVRMTDLYAIPVVLGGGLRYAEKVIKGEDFQGTASRGDNPTLNLEGMECRWNRVKPPADTKEVVCLLVDAKDDSSQASAFRQVLESIDEIYGPVPERMPLSVPQLKVQPALGKISTEMKARLGKFSLGYLLKNWLKTLIGKVYYFPFDQEGKLYLQNLVKLADTLVVDGRINTVISGTIGQREQLRARLDELEAAGEIVYGLHASAESILSCYVRDRKNQHIHFVDGSEGGYTQAANVLKAKLGLKKGQ